MARRGSGPGLGPIRPRLRFTGRVDPSSAAGAVVLFGAAGKTGRAVRAALLARGVAPSLLRALVHRPAGIPGEWTADLTDELDVGRALEGAEVVHLLVPNLHPDERGIVSRAVRAAQENGVPRIVYHSVLRPGVRAMPHHWHKLEAEELLWGSGLQVTVLQPSAYVQNLAACRQGDRLVVPYAVDVPFSLVDVADVGEATARVITEPERHSGAVYELAGPVRTVAGLAAALGLGATRASRAAPLSSSGSSSGLPGYTATALAAMFDWYDRNGLAGSPGVLEWLLGRPAHDPDDVLRGLLPGLP